MTKYYVSFDNTKVGSEFYITNFADDFVNIKFREHITKHILNLKSKVLDQNYLEQCFCTVIIT